MSARVMSFDAKRSARTEEVLYASIDAVDVAIAAASTTAEVNAIADKIAPIAAELMWLVTKARLRADALIPAC